jgi:probable HAF family extracellular repeat protein
LITRSAATAALLALGLPLSPHAGAATVPSRYTITDLGAFTSGAGSDSNASAINNAGVVVGYSDTPTGRHAFRWTNGVLSDLGTLPGGGSSTANAINDAGVVAGTADRFSGGYGYPVKWSASGVVTDLGGPLVNRLGAANAIDPRGRIVGGQRPADSEGSPYAMVYELDGSSRYLADPPEQLGAATGINGLGHITANPGYVVWDGGRLFKMPGLRYFDGDLATVNAINERDQVVGSAPIGDGLSHAVFWYAPDVIDHGAPIGIDIGTVDGISNNAAKAINAAGQVVGTADPMCHPCAAPRAWVWQQGTTVTALDTLIPAGTGWLLQEANGINDQGQIVGRGLLNGHYHAYLLTPRGHANVNFQPASAAVPAGYTADSGAVYGARPGGRTYGWSADDSAFTRERHAAGAPERRYDTLIHAQHPTSANVWELAVPNGRYLVHVVAGDPSYTDSVYRIAVEGTLTVSGTPSATTHWFEGTATVTVTDGRLTLSNATGASNNKLDYVDVIGL